MHALKKNMNIKTMKENSWTVTKSEVTPLLFLYNKSQLLLLFSTKDLGILFLEAEREAKHYCLSSLKNRPTLLSFLSKMANNQRAFSLPSRHSIRQPL